MSTTSPSLSPDLSSIDVFTAPLLPGGEQCVIRYCGRVRANLLLFPDGLFSILSHDMGGRPIDAVLVGLGRVLATHSARGNHGVDGPALRREIAALDVGGLDGAPLKWDDLPGVVATRLVMTHWILQCGVTVEDHAALLCATCDPIMPLTCIQFLAPHPPPPLLLALGRVLFAHHNVVRGSRHRPDPVGSFNQQKSPPSPWPAVDL